MTKAQFSERYRQLGKIAHLLRSGRATPEQVTEYEHVNEELLAWQRAQQIESPAARPRTVFDLPIARGMWEADARDRRVGRS